MSKQEESDLAPVLDEKGLDVKYWLPKFNEKGLHSKTQLQYVKVDSESFKYLVKQSKFDWEENALREIFNIDAEKLQHEKEQKKKESQQILEEANKARLQEKEGNDKQVAALESDKLKQLYRHLVNPGSQKINHSMNKSGKTKSNLQLLVDNCT